MGRHASTISVVSLSRLLKSVIKFLIVVFDFNSLDLPGNWQMR